MAKNKTKDKAKGPKSVPNRHLHARISFLQRAATHLAIQDGSSRIPASPASFSPTDSTSQSRRPAPAQTSPDTRDMDWEPDQYEAATAQKSTDDSTRQPPLSTGLSFHLNSNLRQVARKSQIRLHSSIKRASCKTCSAVLIEGQTCSKYIENLSRGGKKRHADVLVIECTACGSKKRFPVGAGRQSRKDQRAKPGEVLEKTKPVEKKDRSVARL